MSIKRLHNINTYHFFKGDISLAGEDEDGKELIIEMDAYEFIGFIDSDQVKEDLAKWLMKTRNREKYRNPSQSVIMNSTFNKEKEAT
jgi:hypothetical protein